MTIPKLKRIKVSTVQELHNWLGKHAGQPHDVMIVSCSKKSRDKFISGDDLQQAVRENGWDVGRRYTLDGDLVGQVISNTGPR